ARRHQPAGRAPQLDAEARRAGLCRQDNLMVALEHLKALPEAVDRGRRKASVSERKSGRKKGVMAGGGGGRGGGRPRGSGPKLAVAVERWPITGGFTISRGVKHEAAVVRAMISDGAHRRRGGCVRYAPDA